MTDETIDAIDRRILSLLQTCGRTRNSELARELGMAPSATLERVRKLEARGVLDGYRARVDPSAVGLDLLAYVFVRTEETLSGPVGPRLAAIPEVLEVHHVAGEDCYLIKVRTASPEALGRLLRERLGAIPEVTTTRSTIVLETLKEDMRLPLGMETDEGTGAATGSVAKESSAASAPGDGP